MVARRDDEFDDLQWQQSAACRGENASSFYPPSHFERKELRLSRERLAKSICGPVSYTHLTLPTIYSV